MDKVGIGFIGTGFARKVQMPAFAACENAKIVSIASGSLENARLAAEEFEADHYSADWRETAGHPDVDLVCITTPPVMHREMVLAAVEHGKHILCEKPMAMTVAEADEMSEAAADKPLLAVIDHELRFQPGRQQARKMLRDGAIGKVRHVKTIFQAPHRGDPDLPYNWWSDEKSGGGGTLGAINSHIIDSLHWFLGSRISDVYCQLHTNIKERRDRKGVTHKVTSDDEANMLLRFADGNLTDATTGLVSVSMTEGPHYRHTMEFYGDGGVLRVDHNGSAYITERGRTEWSPVNVEPSKAIPGLPDTGFAAAFWSFAPMVISAIREGQALMPNAATFEDGLAVQKVLDAARLSDLEGRRIEVLLAP